MTVVLFMLLGLVSMLIVFSLGMLIRNQCVYDYQMRMLGLVSDQARAEIDGHHDSWVKWYDELDSVTYDEMFYQFWRPLRSFYKGTRLYDLITKE